MKNKKLKGDAAVVTGAAAGIGRASAIKLAENGAKVACLDVDKENLKESVNKIKKSGGEAHSYQVDISQSEQVKGVMKEIFSTLGSIDILVNVAAVISFTSLEECSDEEWQRVLDVNLNGYFYCLREVYPYMKESDNGRIVQFTSTNAFNGSNFAGANYVASKSAIPGLTKYVAKSWAKDGIRANAIAPGLTRTDITTNDAGELHRKEEEHIKNVPLNRVATPEDQAGAVLFLVSEESQYMTGTTLHVHGGKYMYGS